MKKIFLSAIAALNALDLRATSLTLTFDDFPMPETRLFKARERTARLVDTCRKHQCTAVFFCIGDNIVNNPESADHLAMAARNGHFLANHSMTHSALSTISLDQLRREINDTEQLLAPYPTMKKWFRHPYLDYGINKPKGKGSLQKVYRGLELLHQLGYAEGYASINTFDWHINARLQQAIKAEKLIDYIALKHVYLELLEEWCRYYIAFYQNNFAPPFTHTLLFHANDLNALYLEDIIMMIRKNGWAIVSPEIAFDSTGWRKRWLKKILRNPRILADKPPTLDRSRIDAILEKNNCFT